MADRYCSNRGQELRAGVIQPVSRALRQIAAAFLPVVVLLALAMPATSAPDEQTKDGTPVNAGAAREANHTIGAYVTSLRDFDSAGDAFGIDFWVWSVHEPGNNPLKSMEFVNAKQLETRLDQSTEREGVVWSRSKVRAMVLHDWNQSNFPFDRQILTVDLGLAGAHPTAYRVDGVDSGYAEGIAPEGWQVADFGIEERTVEDRTTYGDPNASGESSQGHVFVTLEMERNSVVAFFKLAAGVYAAVAIALLSFLMKTDAPTVFSGRMAVLVGALFATVVNMQVSNSVLGSPEEVSLVDKIHIIALIYVFAAALMAIVSRTDHDSGHKDRARRRDLISLCAFGGSFLIINGILILIARAAG